jgi:hypothetical protein
MKGVLMLRRGLQSVVVVVAIVVLTSFTIDATDTLRGSQTALSILAERVAAPTCPADMRLVDTGDYAFCIDTYEAGVGSSCLVSDPGSPSETALNAVDADCFVTAEVGVVPWRFVTYVQAEQLCARAGKRLPTAGEWYQAALGTVDGLQCNAAGGLANTGEFEGCMSGVGAFDMVGNVWEFVYGEVVSGEFDGAVLPSSGYVLDINGAGIATQTTTTPPQLFNDDYFWSDVQGSTVLLRGGYYGSERDGGLYSTQATVDRNFASGAVGFRCAKSLL